MPEPIERIEWRQAVALSANDYNPNYVLTPELRLLELNLLRHGWLQPILITPDGTIIDGFHRWRLAQDSREVRDRWLGAVPCVVLDLTEPEAMMLTVRMNRAKGVHAAYRMSEVVHRLIDEHGVDRQQIATEIGATRDEVDLLYQDGVFKARNLAEYRYSKAWTPVETG